ncbi:hypothetical protein GCM10011608_10060 [Micromonospora sonchi]|uniref:Uncharacterized protein n=1 Tax=Micromonospora sonchi TaxID=1763543 RepID=A0A917TLN2_9ACTN|nr:hypothetical protein [Micromonospora sonchi]GGM27297.1 hypothetical protein GCM10011608_10060 [Micromonospora sonchi]
MGLLVALLLIAAVVLAAVHAFGVPSRVNLGWLAIACVIAAVWMIPAVDRL